VDMPNNYVHVFNVGGVPGNAPTMTASIPVALISGTESPCHIDCTKEGWLIQSMDGRYLFVGNSGSIIDTTANKVVANLATLANTRMFLEVDWVNGVPINSQDRTDFYWNRGLVKAPQARAALTPVKKLTPTATRTNLGPDSHTATSTDDANSMQQPGTQTSSTGREQSGSNQVFVLIAGAILVLLAAAFFALFWWRKTNKQSASQSATHPDTTMPGAGTINPVPTWSLPPPTQTPPGWGDVSDMHTSPSLPAVNNSTSGSQKMGLLSAANLYSSGKWPEVQPPGGGPDSGSFAAPPNPLTNPTVAHQNSDPLQDARLAGRTPPVRKSVLIKPGQTPPDAP